MNLMKRGRAGRDAPVRCARGDARNGEGTAKVDQAENGGVGVGARNGESAGPGQAAKLRQ
jgi:hypothetical protein